MRRALLVAVLAAGCTQNNLSESWQLDRLRILGVRATPAEPQPGEVTTFQSLIYTPAGVSIEAVIWFACLPESADDFGCELDSDLLSELDPAEVSPEDIETLIDAGLIGVEPLWSPVWTPPEDALDGLDERDALEGVSAVVNIMAMPAGAEGDDDVEMAYKRVPVSLAATPNHNPEITALHVDAAEVPAGDLFTAQRGQTYQIEPILPEDTVEDYTYVTTDGDEETRTEEPYFLWYTEGGAFDQPYSLYPHSSVEWTAPDEAFEGLIVAVLRDRRGGMAWSSIRMAVE